MTEKQFFNIRLWFTVAVAMGIWALLGWNHFHGGVPRHHLLANEELPSVSNGWGALLLPLLTWFLLGRFQKRVFHGSQSYADAPTAVRQGLGSFLAALLFGILLSVFFTLGLPDLCGYMLLSLFPLAIFYPMYRAECLLGFVLGMSFTFGAVLPTGIGALLSLLGLGLYLSLGTGIRYAASKLAFMAPFRK